MTIICNDICRGLVLGFLLTICCTAVAAPTVHVADQNASSNFFFETSTNSWSLGNSYGSGFIPAYIVITPNGLFSYTTSIGSRAVFVNRITGFPSLVTSIPVAGAASGAAPTKIDISPDGSRAYVLVQHLSIANLNHVMILNTATHTTVGTIDTGVGDFDRVSAIKFTPNGQQVWVGHNRQGVIEVIDVATGNLLTGPSYPILSGAGPADIAFTPDGNFAYVTNGGFDDITGIDVDTVTVIDSSDSTPGGIKVLSVGSKPSGIAMTPDGQFAYVANSGSGPGSPINAVSVIATGGSTCAEPLENPPCVLTTIPVGVNPQDVAITQDGQFAYVSNRNSQNVSVISTADNTVTATVSINTGGNLFAGIAIAPPPDADSDGVEDSLDNCVSIPNPGQENHDGDALGDVCDPDDDNDGQTDEDEGACGSNPKDDTDLSPDFDGDDSPDCVDADDDNDNQSDLDEIACGSLPMDENSLSPDNDNDNSPDCIDSDDDNDGVNDDVPDNCPFNANPLQTDTNNNNIGDVCDADLQGDGLIVAATGGEVMTGNGDVSLLFEPGDLPADTEISVAAVETPLNVNLQVAQPRPPGTQDGEAPPVFDLGMVLVAYNFLPNALNFNSGVSLTISVDATAINASQRSAVDVYARQGNGRYLPEGAVCLETENPPETFTISCTVEITHFSIYALVAPRDTDGDGAFDRFEGFEDNCPADFNPGQRDIYGNGIGDVCDPEYIFYDHFEGTNLE